MKKVWKTFLFHRNSQGKRLGEFRKKPQKMRIRIQGFDDQNCKKFDKFKEKKTD